MSNKKDAALRAQKRAARRQQALQETAAVGLRRILRWPDLEAMTGRGRTAIQMDIAAGLFPKPIPLGGRAKGWLITEVESWIAERAAERLDQQSADNAVSEAAS